MYRSEIEQMGLNLYNALRGPLSQMKTTEEMDNFQIELGDNKQVVAECMKCAETNLGACDRYDKAIGVGEKMSTADARYYNNLIIEACKNALREDVMNKHQEMRKEAIQDIVECLENGYSGDYTDLHNEVFNTYYYIVGTYQAKEALREYDVFDAIEKVQEYENDMFGECYTDVSDPEKLVNMLYYIIGDEIIGEMGDIMDDDLVWGESGNPDTNEWIVDQMKELFKDELQEVEK